jgi:ABC-type multidrug transport system fused ATPase/permease subunit
LNKRIDRRTAPRYNVHLLNDRQRAVLASFLGPHRSILALLCVLSAAVAAVEAATILAVLPLSSALFGRTDAALGSGGQFLYRCLDSLGTDRVTASALLLLALVSCKSALSLASEWLISRLSGDILQEAKDLAFAAYARAPYRYFVETPQGKIVYALTVAPQKLSYVVLKVPQLFIDAVRVSALGGVLFWLSPRLTLLLIVGGWGLDRLLSRQTAGLSYNSGGERQKAVARQAVLLNEFVNGFKEISVLGAKRAWLNAFSEAGRVFRRHYIRDSVLLALPKNALETAALGLGSLSLLLLHWRDQQALLAAAPLAVPFALAGLKLLPALANVSRSRMEIHGALPDIEAVHASLAADFPQARMGGRPFDGLKEGVRFEGVRLSYGDGAEALRGVDLEIPKGRTVALVGDSGGGKTSVVNVLLGLYEPTAGRVLIDGHPLSELDLEAWQRRIGIVSQEPFLAHATVAENIRLGREGFGAAEIERAARVANIHDFIMTLPRGYDTLVGEKGLKLSGGQRQRISIARAVLGQPEILLLDEATSALDSASEKAVQDALTEASRGRTVVQVAHRLSTIEGAHRIHVLHQGRVIEQGGHGELLALGGRYAAFHALQTQGPAS